jgi:hypothetical protein
VKSTLRLSVAFAILLLVSAIVYREARVADLPANVADVASASSGSNVAPGPQSDKPAQTTRTGVETASNSSAAPASGSAVVAQLAPDASNRAQQVPDATPQPGGYTGADRWIKTPVPCWGIRGTAPDDFRVSADREEHSTGKSSIALSSIRSTDGWGTLYQFASAEPLRGQRVEFTADLKTSAVQRGASLLVRVDDAEGRAIAIDNMVYSYGADRSDDNVSDRSLRGDNDWTSASVVLDIPADAHAISYGVALTGSGTLWLDNAHLEAVSRQTPITGIVRDRTELKDMPPFRMSEIPSAPKNLDFELGEWGCP